MKIIHVSFEQFCEYAKWCDSITVKELGPMTQYWVKFDEETMFVSSSTAVPYFTDVLDDVEVQHIKCW